MYLDAGAVADFARGCAVLGSGGGGPVGHRRALAEQAIEECGPVRVLPPAALPADALVMPVSMVGSPAVEAERIGGRGEPARLRERVEKVHGRPVAAVLCGEIGGLNGCVALAWAARLGLPLLDADSIGRAFPRVDQNVLEIAGVRPGPAVLADEWGRTVVLDHVDGPHFELLARAAVDAFGGRAASCDYSLTAGEAAAYAVAGSVTQALLIGRELGGRSGAPGDANATHGTDGGPASDAGEAARRLPVRRLTGKVVSVRRGGAETGDETAVLVEGTGPDADRLVLLECRSEFVAALENGGPLALVPDVIALVDTATGDAVPVEEIGYGRRVHLLTLPSAPAWYTAAGLRLAGPAAFGLTGLAHPADGPERADRGVPALAPAGGTP